MFLHQQVHLLQQNSQCGCSSRVPLPNSFAVWSNPNTALWEVLLPSDHSLGLCVVLLHVSWSVCVPFWCEGLLMWIPLSEGCGALTLSSHCLYHWLWNCDRGSLNDLSKHFSAKLELSFECNRSGIHTERHERTCCDTNSILYKLISHSSFLFRGSRIRKLKLIK